MDTPEAVEKRFCTECGALLEEGAAFCTECGTKSAMPAAGAASAKAEGAPSATPVVRPVPPATQAATAPSSSVKKTPVIIAIIVAVVAVIILVAVLLVTFVFSGAPAGDEEAVQELQEQEVSDQQSQERSEAAISPEDVRLTNQFTTQFEKVNKVTYPAFTCSYPDDWELVASDVNPSGETFELQKTGTDIGIQFEFRSGAESNARFRVTSIEKVWSSHFWPSYVQGTDLMHLGPFMVANVGVSSTQGSDAGGAEAHLALVPEEALTDKSACAITGSGAPGFEYVGIISFACDVPTEELSAEAEAEVTAILSSFSNGTTKEDYELALQRSSAGVRSGTNAADGYLLPDSDARFYSESEFSDLSLYYLYLARNEIFARRGRLFNNADLQNYFNGKSWYHGTIAPEDFDEGVFNEYERRNAAALLEYERSQGSPYLNP